MSEVNALYQVSFYLKTAFGVATSYPFFVGIKGSATPSFISELGRSTTHFQNELKEILITHENISYERLTDWLYSLRRC